MLGLAKLRAMDLQRRSRAARWVALAVDVVQIAVFPIFFPGSPWNTFLDVLTAIFMIAMLGWHVALLPTVLTELIPFVDLFPTWTVAVVFITRKRKGQP